MYSRVQRAQFGQSGRRSGVQTPKTPPLDARLNIAIDKYTLGSYLMSRCNTRTRETRYLSFLLIIVNFELIYDKVNTNYIVLMALI